MRLMQWRVEWHIRGDNALCHASSHEKFLQALNFAQRIRHHRSVTTVWIVRVPDLTKFWLDGEFV